MNLERYARMYEDFTTRVAYSSLHLESLVLESEKEVIMPFVVGARIIYDLGTGNGRIPLFLASSGFSGQVVGVDSNKQMIPQQGLMGKNTYFVNDDILGWLKRVAPADLIICMGNTVGGFLDEQYRTALFPEVLLKLRKGSYFLIDYRPIDVVINNDVVLERHEQRDGELIVTGEEILGEKIELCQFYPDETFEGTLTSLGFDLVKKKDLEGTKYFRRVLILKPHGGLK